LPAISKVANVLCSTGEQAGRSLSANPSSIAPASMDIVHDSRPEMPKKHYRPGPRDYTAPMIQALSHLVVAAKDVPGMAAFFQKVFEIAPYFQNEEFCEFVLPAKARVAFFSVTGKTKKFFRAESEREGVSYGVTVDNVARAFDLALESGLEVSGPPKDHPWGEKSFLLIDPEGNRWEITKSPSADGFLVNHE
jgi:hypothetical protein